ncbi:Molecular chaperone, DnaJ family protein, partial [Giardia duodenalis]
VSPPQNPAPDNAKGAASLQRTSCLDEIKAPVDGVCASFGSNRCRNGYCTHCMVNHTAGRVLSSSKKGAKICAEVNQIEIGGYSTCKQCTNTSEAHAMETVGD